MIERGHLGAGGGEEGFGLLALGLAVGQLRLEGVERALEIVGVAASLG